MEAKKAGGCICRELAGPEMDLSPVCLSDLWIFSSLSPGEEKALMARADQRRYDPGEQVFSQGQEARRLYLIKGGRIKLTRLSQEGRELTLDILKAGDSLGENLLNQAAFFPFTASCMEESVICGLSRAAFEELVLEHPNVGLQVIKSLSWRIERLNARVGSLALTSLEDRLLGILNQMAREHGARDGDRLVLGFPLTHEELGFLVGAHRVSVTRAIKGLMESGRLAKQGGSYVLLDTGSG